jgi:hypothetical protein
LGHIPTPWGEQDKVRISFELPTETAVFNEEKGPQPRVVSAQYTLSFNEKASLRKVSNACELETKKDPETGWDYIDVEDLAGKPCLVTVGVKEREGRKFNYVENIAKLVKGMEVAPQINPTMIFDVGKFDKKVFDTLPEFIQNKVKESTEYKMMQKDSTDIVDEIPF